MSDTFVGMFLLTFYTTQMRALCVSAVGDPNPKPDPVRESWKLFADVQQFTVQNRDQLVFTGCYCT